MEVLSALAELEVAPLELELALALDPRLLAMLLGTQTWFTHT